MLINNISIKENKIIGVIGATSIERLKFCNTIKKMNINKISNISVDNLNFENTIKEEFEYYLINVNETDKIKKENEVLRMVGLSQMHLSRFIYELSESEKMKVSIACMLFLNSKIIIIEDSLNILDNKTCNKILKILIRLKKYYDRTIFISGTNINCIYECLDDIIYLENENNFKYADKYSIYCNNNLDVVPDVVKFTNLMRKKYRNMRYTDSINELIKELYREIR